MNKIIGCESARCSATANWHGLMSEQTTYLDMVTGETANKTKNFSFIDIYIITEIHIATGIFMKCM